MESKEKATVKVGDILRIIKMDDNNGIDNQVHDYAGRTGIVNHIDSAGQFHGTWGGIAIIPQIDKYEIVESKS